MRVSHIDDLPRIPSSGPGDPEWRPIRAPLGVSAFGINAFAAGAGETVIEEHDEGSPDGAGGHEEVYLVVRGEVELTCGGEKTLLGPGAIVAITDPAARRVGIAQTDDTVVVAVGAQAGVVFTPSEWETRELGNHGLL